MLGVLEIMKNKNIMFIFCVYEFNIYIRHEIFDNRYKYILYLIINIYNKYVYI